MGTRDTTVVKGEEVVRLFKRLSEKHQEVTGCDMMEVPRRNANGNRVVLLRPRDRGLLGFPLQVALPKFTVEVDPSSVESIHTQLDAALHEAVRALFEGRRVRIEIDESQRPLTVGFLFAGHIPYKIAVEGDPVPTLEILPGVATDWRSFVLSDSDREEMRAAIRAYYESKPVPCDTGVCGVPKGR